MNRTGCGLITITLIHLPGITGITTTSGLGMAHGTGHHGAAPTGTILGIGTIHTGGITDTTPTAPEEEETIAHPYKDPRTGIPAIRIWENVLDRKETITLVEIKADVRPVTTGRLTTALLLTRLSAQKATIAVLREIRRHLPARGPLRVPDSNPAPDPLPAGTEAIRPLRPTASVRAMRTYAEDRPLPIGEVRHRVRKTG